MIQMSRIITQKMLCETMWKIAMEDGLYELAKCYMPEPKNTNPEAVYLMK